jgi:hypothetical protein
MIVVEETRRRRRTAMLWIVVEAIPLDIAPVEEMRREGTPPLASPRVEVGESSSHHHCSRNLVIPSRSAAVAIVVL